MNIKSRKAQGWFPVTFCGCLVALLYAVIMQAPGYSQLENLPSDMATGCATGFFYRLFAGTKPA
jgi:hypothetical protein